MWRTGTGNRTIRGAEWALIREAILGLWNRVEEAGNDWNVHPSGVEIFDVMQPHQKLAMLALVGEALSNPKVKPPKLTAVNEATIAAMFALLTKDVVIEIDLAKSPTLTEDGGEMPDWTAGRKLLLAAYREANHDEENDEEDDTGKPLDATSEDLTFWESIIEDLKNQILWEDGDYEMGREFLDLSPVARIQLANQLGIDAKYFLAIAPDPTDLQMEAVLERLRVLTERIKPK